MLSVTVEEIGRDRSKYLLLLDADIKTIQTSQF
jgi:hypothetical protein